MNIEYMNEFVVLAETCNFWEASERLYMNQSTLSKHIKSLENDLGVALFKRTTRHVALTSYGRIFLPYARSISRAHFDGMAAIKRGQNVESGLLTIGTLPSMPQYRVTQLLANFQTCYPKSSVRITEDDPARLIDLLENEICELVFTREDKQNFESNFVKDIRIKRIPYIKDQLVVLMQKSHPLSGAPSINLQQLSTEAFCLLKEGSLMYDISMDACQRAGFVPEIIFTSHRPDSIIDMVTNRNCIALLMNQHVEMFGDGSKQLDVPWKAIPIVPSIESQISLCYRVDQELSDTAKEFIGFFEDSVFRETSQ